MKFKGHFSGMVCSNGDGRNLLTYKVESDVAEGRFAIFPKMPDEKLNELLPKQKDEIYQIEIKRYREKRSNDANSYMWVLCDAIASKLGNGMTKEEVYRKAVREVGVFEVVPLKKEALPRFISSWSKNGVGWIAESLGKSKLAGYINLVCYYGSSTYNTKEMSRLIDYIVEEAKDLGIETMPKDELEAIKNAWGV